MIVVAFMGLAAVGTLIRITFAQMNRPSFPVGTLAVNVVGSFLLGWASSSGLNDLTLVGTAALGSITTFSTLMNESVGFSTTGQARRAVLYLTITLVGGVAAAILGLEVGA